MKETLGRVGYGLTSPLSSLRIWRGDFTRRVFPPLRVWSGGEVNVSQTHNLALPLLILTLKTKLLRWFTPSVSLRLPPPPCTGEAGRGCCPHRSDIMFRKLCSDQ